MSNGINILMLIIIVVSVIAAVIQQTSVTKPGKELAAKFANIGTLSGKTKEEVIAKVGGPNSVSALPEGKTLLQWQATGYHIALRFNGEICEGVTHEFMS